MSVTVPTKDVGDVQDRRLKKVNYKILLEDRNEEYIKLNMGLRE